MEELTGIRFGLGEQPWGPLVHITDFDHPITRDLGRELSWGTNAKLAPIFHVDDPDGARPRRGRLLAGQLPSRFRRQGIPGLEVCLPAPLPTSRAASCGRSPATPGSISTATRATSSTRTGAFSGSTRWPEASASSACRAARRRSSTCSARSHGRPRNGGIHDRPEAAIHGPLRSRRPARRGPSLTDGPGRAAGTTGGPDSGTIGRHGDRSRFAPRPAAGSSWPGSRRSSASSPIDVDESSVPEKDPLDVRHQGGGGSRPRPRPRPFPVTIVIGADTVVALGLRILGKPADRDDAQAMLRALSGRRHRVITGLAFYHQGRGPAAHRIRPDLRHLPGTDGRDDRGLPRPGDLPR